jgi:hypothetical protein
VVVADRDQFTAKSATFDGWRGLVVAHAAHRHTVGFAQAKSPHSRPAILHPEPHNCSELLHSDYAHGVAHGLQGWGIDPGRKARKQKTTRRSL